MQFSTPTQLDGIVERPFLLDDVPGILWTPDARRPPLVLMGHPGGMSIRAPGFVARALTTVRAGFAVAAIDAPGHGARPRSNEDARWVERLGAARRAGGPLGAIVSEFNASLAERAVPEWRTVLDGLLDLPEFGASTPVGYTGMTVATEIGMRLVAAESRIRAAVLGGGFASDALLAVAASITVPVQYLVAWDDPEIDRESSLALYDAFGSAEKSMHVNQGSHRHVPAFETDDSVRFLLRHLRAAR